MGRSVGQSDNQSVSQSVGQSDNQSVSQSVGQSDNQSVSQSVGQSVVGQSVGSTILSLTLTHQLFLLHTQSLTLYPTNLFIHSFIHTYILPFIHSSIIHSLTLAHSLTRKSYFMQYRLAYLRVLPYFDERRVSQILTMIVKW